MQDQDFQFVGGCVAVAISILLSNLRGNSDVSALRPWKRKHVRRFVFSAEAPVQFLDPAIAGDQDVHLAGNACHFLRPSGKALELFLADTVHGCFKYDHALLKQIGRALAALPLKILLDPTAGAGVQAARLLPGPRAASPGTVAGCATARRKRGRSVAPVDGAPRPPPRN